MSQDNTNQTRVPNIGLTEDQAGVIYKHFIKVITTVLSNLPDTKDQSIDDVRDMLISEFFGDKLNPLYELMQGQGPRTNCAVMIGEHVFSPGTLYSTIIAAARSQYISKTI